MSVVVGANGCERCWLGVCKGRRGWASRKAVSADIQETLALDHVAQGAHTLLLQRQGAACTTGKAWRETREGGWRRGATDALAVPVGNLCGAAFDGRGCIDAATVRAVCTKKLMGAEGG